MRDTTYTGLQAAGGMISPWLETSPLTEDEGWGKNPAYLHYGSAGGIGIETEADDATKTYSIKGLEGYDYDDIKLEDWDKTVDGIAANTFSGIKPDSVLISMKTVSLCYRKTSMTTRLLLPILMTFISVRSPIL